MRKLAQDPSWPASWLLSHAYDMQEVYDADPRSGYATAYRSRRDVALALVQQHLPAGARILDMAAAQGNFSITLAERGYDVTWNDLREDLADYVRLKHEHGALRFAPGNAFELAFDEPFDGVLITEIIEHVAHPDQFLKNASRLVKPGGVIVMTTPNGAYCRNTLPRFSDCPDPSLYEAVQFKPNADGHIFLLHADELHRFASGLGLEVCSLRYFTNPLTTGHLKSEALLRRLPQGLVTAVEALTRQLPETLRRRCMVQMAAALRKHA